MSVDPAELKQLRNDRIYDYDEFNSLRARYGGAPKLRPSIFGFRPRRRLVPFTLRVRYETALAAGIVLLLASVVSYGLLATSVVNKDYRLLETNRNLHNLSLALGTEALENKNARDQLVYNGKVAKSLGLVPPLHAKYVVRTNIRPGCAGAKTVDELYPLSDRIIQIQP